MKKIKNNRISVGINGNDINVKCKSCGKPIIQSNDYGMYCEDYCGQNDDKEAYEKIKTLMNMFFK